MVLKLWRSELTLAELFENDVKMYGTQTANDRYHITGAFENDVKMYGTQTVYPVLSVVDVFENDVKTYGTQTPGTSGKLADRLRMM